MLKESERKHVDDVDEGLGHHEVGNYDGHNYRVVLVDEVDTLEVSINEGDKRETSW